MNKAPGIYFIKPVVLNHNNGYDPHDERESWGIFHCFSQFFFFSFLFFWLFHHWLKNLERLFYQPVSGIQVWSFLSWLKCFSWHLLFIGYSIIILQSTIDNNLLPTYIRSTMNIKPHNSSFSGLNNIDNNKYMRVLKRSLLLFVKYQGSLICNQNWTSLNTEMNGFICYDIIYWEILWIRATQPTTRQYQKTKAYEKSHWCCIRWFRATKRCSWMKWKCLKYIFVRSSLSKIQTDWWKNRKSIFMHFSSALTTKKSI